MRFHRVPKFLKWNYRGSIWQGKKSDIYLTFDDGPHPVITPWVISILDKYSIKATFFCVGKNVETYPEVFEQIKTSGHVIGNHTMHHERGWHCTLDKYIDSVKQASIFIPSKLFRPPFGSITFRQFRALKKLGYKVVFWSWISYDFDKDFTGEEILKEAIRIKGGDILVFHDSDKAKMNLQNSLEEIIVLLKQKGLKFSTW